MKFLKRFLVTILLVGAMATQSGCIAGLVSGNAPLAWVGFGIWVVGASTKTPVLAISGIILDGENTSRSDVLNPLPLDQEVADALGVSTLDLQTYNDELNSVITADESITSVLRTAYENKTLSDAELNDAATLVGLTSGKELVNVLKGDELSQANLETFASSFEMSPQTAELYLKRRWFIKIENR